MKQLLTITAFYLALTVQLNGQADIFEGLFGKEAPEFHASLSPAKEEGVAQMDFYFTHPNIDELEISFWVKDLGANLMAGGEKKLVQGLQEFGNRQQASIRIEGLKNRHFYTIGLDYRGGNAISRKFASKVLEESYRYEYQEEAPSAPATAPATAQQRKSPEPSSQPCSPPSLFVKVDPAGYCGGANRPAVLIQCDNCQGQPWEFSVEARTEFGPWEPLRADGKRQQALGVATRTEPLCTLAPGAYYFRVLAWGDNCSSPSIQTIGTAVRIPGDEPAPALLPDTRPKAPAIADNLPDTCVIESEAFLEGSLISGFIELSAASPCSAYNPFAKVRYVHPGYRDITIGQVALAPGEDVGFKVQLDSRDLSRGIHPLQVVVCIRPNGSTRDIPVSSFWIRAEPPGSHQKPVQPMQEQATPDTDGGFLAQWQQAQGATPEPGQDYRNTPVEREIFAPANITTGSPGCDEIQGLQLIYVPERPGQPLYISWANPNCCREEGCEYTVWAGPNPSQLSMLVKGQKPGETVRELIQGADAGTAYYEIAVRTPSGIRKAAYATGQGPLYGIEAVESHRRQFGPAPDDILAAAGENSPGSGIQLSGGLAARAGGMVAPETGNYQQPTVALSDFSPCRIFRETHIIADKPIQDGDRVTIEYDYNDKAYLYSLYHLPEGASEWVVASGTREFQRSPSFEIQASAHHTGKYVILAIKKDKSWGCLSAPVSDPIEIQVFR
ncbi:MAG: hypothetical protein J5I94_16955 [Phaeodactylibacter sp.]|nr:hypothetical protein [Phaeodactylibacter sp.]